MGSPVGSVGKESTCNIGDTGDAGLITRSGRSPGGGHGYPPQYSFMENPMDRGAWRATVHGDSESDMTEVTEHTHLYLFSIKTRLFLAMLRNTI